ncbi:MAG: membrane protein insertase YidC [Marinifilaceae bacterium]
MDRNSITGLVLIGIILIGYTWLTKPTEEQIRAKQVQDSIERVEAQQALQKEEAEQVHALELAEGLKAEKDSLQMVQEYGVFAQGVQGKEDFVSLENELIRVKLSNKGGRVYSVELKTYQTHDSLPLILWEGEQNHFGLSFYSQKGVVNTQDLFFTPQDDAKKVVATHDAKSVSMRLYAGEEKYIEYKYTLEPDSYMMDFRVNVVGMSDVIARRSNYLTFDWKADLPSQEKGRKFENQYTALYYKYFEDDVEQLSAGSNEMEELTTKVKWLGFKQQFFSSVLIAEDTFKGVKINSINHEETSPILKTMSAEISLPYMGSQLETYPMQFYFGPNHYLTLRKYGKDIEMHKLVDLGWKIFGWVNRFVVIEIFNFLEKFTGNYGLIILLLTLIIKLALAPLTYKSYLSTAKMRVLKPQIDAINEKYPKEKAMERQQATMALYKKAGVNPMGGCLPMLLQFPILIAMFRFFPASIELRQKSFLWATDLSTYDSILELPFEIWQYGDHVSLFCLLMAITNLVYTRMNQQMTSSSQQMPGMQTMMYLMPLMFLFWFNNYASGLSYYYFIATLFTIVQTWAIRKFMVDDEKVLAMMEASKKRPVKKSKFQQRLEEMAKQKGYQPPKK